ncbi:outer membrane protein assembly factor BamB family protein [Alienimonas californiensis]|uniref:outer membrane protein assembly factor BamB family protein n=1 Tax=Alienimonas californiensis TaxID=2527989 RepID=UPI0011A76BF7|nr:PQQ-binding-like beta-propeller repeat protein [Alienimonas californiensis]
MSLSSPARRSVLLLGAAVWVGLGEVAGWAAPPFLPPPAPAAEAAFAALAPLANEERWDEWAAALRDARDRAASDWLPAPLVSGAAARWLGPDGAVELRLAEAPPAARAAWERATAARVGRLAAEAEADPSDPRPPFTLARELPFSPAGRAAAGDLAAAAFREGRLDEARRRWAERARLAPDGPLSSAAAEDWGNVIAADLAAGRFALAEWERTRFLAAFPEAGERSAWATPPDPARWPPRALPDRTRAPQQNGARDGRLRALPAPFATPAARALAAGGPSWAVPRVGVAPAGNAAGAVPSAPAIWEDVVLYNAGDRVVGLALADGRPRWPIGLSADGLSADGQPDDGTLYPPPPAFELPAPFPDALGAVGADREPPPVGAVRHGVALFGALAVARLGDPAVEWPPEALRAPTSSLVCLDLRREGELRWETPAEALQTDAAALDPAAAAWSWEGTPALGLDLLTGAPRAFAVARRNRPRPLLEAVALDLADGSIRWRAPLGAARSVPAPGVRTRSSITPTLVGGRLFVDAGAGAVACLDAADGRPVWLTAHDRAPAAAAASSEPPAVIGGRVFLAPTGAPGLRTLDAETGLPLWARDLPGVGERVLGVAANRLLVAAARGLWGLEPTTGETAWHIPAPRVLPGPVDAYAAGLIGDDTVCWATADRLVLVDAATGAARGVIPLAEAGVRTGALAGSPAGAVLLTPRALVGWTGQPAERDFPLAALPTRSVSEGDPAQPDRDALSPLPRLRRGPR